MDEKRIRLEWVGEGSSFRVIGETHPPMAIDGDSRTGPSPMEALLAGVAGCMAIDIRLILEKSRVPLRTLEAEVIGSRAPEPPRRFTAIRLHFRIGGPSADDEPRILRAIALSRETYCSVLHSLRPDVPVEITHERRHPDEAGSRPEEEG